VIPTRKPVADGKGGKHCHRENQEQFEANAQGRGDASANEKPPVSVVDMVI
jgi:hypothetical protein